MTNVRDIDTETGEITVRETPYQLFPDLSDEDYAALKADIRQRGVLVPVELDERDNILDGHHRIRAWQELRAEGVDLADYPRILRPGMTEEQKRNHVRSLNVNRRHLSKEARAQVWAQMRSDGMSYRAIAEATGVDPMTVHKSLQGVENSTPETVTGSDGKTYPARKPRVSTPAIFAPDASLQVALAQVPDPVRAVVLAHGVHDAEAVLQLADARAKGLETWDVFVTTGALDGTIGAGSLTGRDVERHREQAHQEHRAQALAENYDGDEWYTPPAFIEAARELMGAIDLDPASCEAAQGVVQATEYFTKDDDGLTQAWHGRVWLNPPYSQPLIEQFTQHLTDQFDIGNTTEAVLLVNNCTDAGWFIDLARRFPVIFTYGRAKFWQENQKTFATRQGQAIFYFGSQPERFVECFEKLAYAPNVIGVQS